MIELLILYKLSQKVFTMYGIFHEICTKLKVLTTPSLGTIKPALTRMEAKGWVKFQKSMSAGGRRSTFYSITPEGQEALRTLLLAPIQENPIQFLTLARVRVICSGVLNTEDKKRLFTLLKVKAEKIMIDTKNLMKDSGLDFYTKMVFDNLLCECNNMVSLLEGLEHAGKN